MNSEQFIPCRSGPPAARRTAISACLFLMSLAGLTACSKFNQPSQPCPEISAAAFESALSAGETRGEIEISGNGLVSSQFGGSLKTCRKDKTALGGEICRRSRDLVVRYTTVDRGVFFVRVPSGRWHKFDARYHPGACTLLP
jgi:hypothetical protein